VVFCEVELKLDIVQHLLKEAAPGSENVVSDRNKLRSYRFEEPNKKTNFDTFLEQGFLTSAVLQVIAQSER
jgi:hypothetical protein